MSQIHEVLSCYVNADLKTRGFEVCHNHAWVSYVCRVPIETSNNMCMDELCLQGVYRDKQQYVHG